MSLFLNSKMRSHFSFQAHADMFNFWRSLRLVARVLQHCREEYGRQDTNILSSPCKSYGSSTVLNHTYLESGAPYT